MPLSCARAAARCGPCRNARELCLGSSLESGVVALMRRTLATVWRVASVGGADGRAAGGALEALALPAAQPPDVALEHLRVDLAARQVHVGLGDQAPLVALERHPLGQHVVGVRQPRGAVRAGLVRELDAVLVEQTAGLRQVGHDRAVRVDEVRVRGAAQVARERRLAVAALATPDADEPEVAVHLPLLVVHARLQELAGALLGAALAAWVVARQAVAVGAAGAVGAEDLDPAGDRRAQHLPEQGEDDDRGDGEGEDHARAPANLTSAAGGAREEDDAIGGAWDVLERTDHLGLAAARLGLHRDRGPHPLVELAAELRDEPLLVLGQLDVALGDQLLAVAGAHAQELHVAIMSRGARRTGGRTRQTYGSLRPRSG